MEKLQSLEELCGIDNVSKPPRAEVWMPVVIRFHGAENYVLGTKRSEISLTTHDGGFGLVFRKVLHVPAEQFLGSVIRHGWLTDVTMTFEPVTTLPRLSLASLCPRLYPQVLRSGEVIRVG